MTDLSTSFAKRVACALFHRTAARERPRSAQALGAVMREQDHDPGELAYLEALCHFHGNEFHEAIYWAKKVSAGTIDYPTARAVVLEAHAFLSDTDGLVGELQASWAKGHHPIVSRLSHAVEHSTIRRPGRDGRSLQRIWEKLAPGRAAHYKGPILCAI